MKRAIQIVFVAAVVCVSLVSVVSADWNPGDSALFVQSPDLSTEGIDINSTYSLLQTSYANADDFTVSQSTKITDLHIWGSWKDDTLPDYNWWAFDPDTGEPLWPPAYDPGYVKFSLSIYDNVPAYTDPTYNYPYSTPGDPVWSMTFDPENPVYDDGWFTTSLYADELQEGFMNPLAPLEYVFPGDTECYQYNFYITEDAAFSAQAGQVYWLVLTADPLDDLNDPQFGWKTSDEGHNDKAVSWDQQLIRWQMIQKLGQTYDMAFVVTPEPATLSLLVLGGLALIRRRRKA